MATSKVQVQALQAALNRWATWLSLSPLVVDGITGKYTLAAVKAALASDAANPSGVAYDFVTTPTILISTDGLVVNLTELFNQSADAQGFPPAKPIPASKASGSGSAMSTTQPAAVGRDQTTSAGMLGLGLPNWAVYTGGAAFLASMYLLIRGRKKRKELNSWLND